MEKLIEGLGINLWSLIVFGFNFLVLLFLLGKFAYGPILKKMDERAAKIDEGLKAAEKARTDAQHAQEEMRKQMETARQESTAVLEEARRASERFREEERGKARAELAQLREKALSDIQRERDTAIEQVRQHFADLAVTAAEKVVARSVDRRAHQELIDQVLREGKDLSKQGK